MLQSNVIPSRWLLKLSLITYVKIFLIQETWTVKFLPLRILQEPFTDPAVEITGFPIHVIICKQVNFLKKYLDSVGLLDSNM